MIGSGALRADAYADAQLSLNFIALSLAACAIATLGLLENSVAVIIGAMIVAPLMRPIQAFAFAALDGDWRLVRSSIATAFVGAVIAVASSTLLGSLVALPTYGSEVTARTRPGILDLLIAFSAGGVAGFAKVRPAIASAIAGTAIAVALMPPLCVVGLMLAHRNWPALRGALLLFGTNFIGIALACMIVYIAAGELRRHNRVGIVTTALVTAALIFPLGASTLEIVRQARIEADIRRELTTDTVTFRRARLVAAQFDWYADPVQARLTVSSQGQITAPQVHDLETFIERTTGTKLSLTLDVGRYATVTDAATTLGVATTPGPVR